MRILVHNADDMVDYLEKNFGMKPVKVQVYENRGMKNAIYKVGDTNLEFTEPLDPNSGMGKFLEREGPGIYHIAFGVDNLREAARELAAKGNKMRGQDGITQSAEGYLTTNIDPESSLGFPFQIAEG
ncbi:MAG TPA: VOC family protein [Dehalococcoidia bacterium]|nr:VOC family protein [Dehalococcoidia bacterium]